MKNAYSYDYTLPPSLIATRPASPRDAARLFIYDTLRDEITFDTFSNLGAHLPEHSLLVLNDTKVVPARAMLKKETGGKIEILFLVNEWRRNSADEPIPALVDRKIAVGANVFFDESKNSLTVVRQNENIFYLKPNFPANEIFKLLDKNGVTPLPKYIKGSNLSEAKLRKEYQAVFGEKPASVAAPTASLHFTNSLLARLEKRGVAKTFVTLNVGLGTFAPVSAENIAHGTLHTEFLTIPARSCVTIATHKNKGEPVVAVGTTVVRALEAEESKILSRNSDTHRGTRGTMNDINDVTQIFIRPPYTFKIVDAMVTNFHLPGTSLMMLVQAFLSQQCAKTNRKKALVDLYKIAIEEKFRFYSFGDAMLIK